MIQLRDTKYANTADFLQNAIRAAEFYGFTPLETAEARKNNCLPPIAHIEKNLSLAKREERMLLSSVRRCLLCATPEKGSLLFWRVVRAPGKTSPSSVSLDLHVIGASSALAEALLLIVADAIARDAGLEKRTIAINSIGTVESSVRFVRDVSTFIRKNIESLAPALRVRATEDPLGTLVQMIERGHPAVHRAPQAMEYLSEEERRRLWDLLEHLETCGLVYELSPHVLGSRDFWSHTLFEAYATQPESETRFAFAEGGRYDPLARAFAGSPTPSAMIRIAVEARGRLPDSNALLSHTAGGRVPLYFAHLGPEARRRALPFLESLRQMGIQVSQSIMREKISEQMQNARSIGAPYLLIMGHKEAMEGTVLFREIATNSQRAVPLDEIPTTLRRFRALTPA